jgi:hypothetical protein
LPLDIESAIQAAGEWSSSLRMIKADKDELRRSPYELHDNFSTRWPWQRVNASSESMLNSEVSAQCFWFGVEQLRRRPEVPIGLLQLAFGATNARQWAPSGALAECGIQEQKTGRLGSYDQPVDTSVLWNTFLHPFTVLSIRAFIVELDGQRWSSCLLPAMVKSWRESWGARGDASGPPLIAMQTGCCDWCGERRPGDDAYLRAPHTAVAVVADLCDQAHVVGNCHSPRKMEEAQRFALIAEGLVHGNKSVPTSGPRPVAACTVTCPNCSAKSGPSCMRLRVLFDQEVVVRPGAASVNHTDYGFTFHYGNRSENLTFAGLSQGDRRVVELEAASGGRCGRPAQHLQAANAGAPLGSVAYGTQGWPEMPLANSLGMPVGQFNFSVQRACDQGGGRANL